MKTYSVTFDMKENCTNCVEVNQVARYVVSADTQHTFFNITVEADNGKDALIIAALYIQKYIWDRAGTQVTEIAKMAMMEY